MSTKWNNAQKLQKTPAVCKKPPIILDPSIETWEQYPLIAWCNWSDPFTPLDGSVTGLTQLSAEPASNLHFGTIEGQSHSLEIDLLYNAGSGLFQLTVSLLLGTTVIDDRSVSFTDPPAQLPFTFGQHTWIHDGTTAIVQIKIYS